MSKPKPETLKIKLDANPKGELKPIGGAKNDAWNLHLSNLIANAIPAHDTKYQEEAACATFAGMIDINPADPIEGMLIGQIIAANEAALASYRKAWAQPSEYFEARLKYLAVADKAARTTAMLTERLDRHRTQGQQHITVKHVTVNADQAVVTDTIVTGTNAGNPLSAARLLTAKPDSSLQMLRATKPEPDLVPVGRGKEPE